MRRTGFTLIELMIVVAVIAIIAAIALPGLLRSKLGANEASTTGTMKSISTGQECFKISCAIDLNNDGQGEYGFLEEVAGTRNCRSDNAGTTNGGMYGPSPYVPRALGVTNAAGQSSKSGYLFVLYLPAGPGAATNVYPSPVSVPLSSTSFVCYAFPESAGRTGNVVLAVETQASIHRWANTLGTFSGAATPQWNAAFGDNDGTAGVTWNDSLDLGGPGQAGVAAEKWLAAGG